MLKLQALRRLATTLAASAFLAFFAVPALAAPSAGDLVKLADDGNPGTMHDRAVYYVGTDARRYAFPNAKTYATWYDGFGTVKVITASEMAALQLAGNVTYRPGTRLVKVTTDPKVYAVERGGVLRPVASESVAVGLYGSSWNTKVDDVPDEFFSAYALGEPDVVSDNDVPNAGPMSTATSTTTTGS